MQVTFELIHGLCFGIEHVSKNDEEMIDESVIILEIGFFRWLIWLGDYDS